LPPKTVLTILDDIRVVVPDSLDLITTYVLREQGDWFEDEIRFVRLVLKPGGKAIDIGANYGVFALSMAKVVGAGGAVWAFEPASSTAACLAESLAANGFAQVTLDRRALSAQAGTARLSLHDNAELNELVRSGAAAGRTETVPLTSLDEASEQYGWSDIDFMKIDAEGEEEAILRGGRDFFRAQSPLVQYEVKAGSAIHLELVEAFREIGYSSYRLVPGLGVLVPFDSAEPVDGYLLNLFCCKPDRAAKTAADGLLVGEAASAGTAARGADDLLARRNAGSAYGWRRVLARLPYGKPLADRWQETVAQGGSGEVERALALHAIAHDANVPPAERVLALRASLDILASVCESRPDYLRYCSLARVAREFGSRMVSVMALSKVFDLAKARGKVDPGEPFLAAGERFDTLDPGDSPANWVIGSVLEELERSGWFSSYYSGASARGRLELIRKLGFGSPEMARRLALVEQRFSPVREDAPR
jgi:FkbM family methyltransferase